MNRHKFDSFSFFWWGSKTLYPSKMAKNLDGINLFSKKHFFIKFLRECGIKNIQYSETMKFDKSKIKLALKAYSEQISNCLSLDDLRKLNYEKIFPGPALMNSLVSELKDSEINIQKHLKLVYVLLKSYLCVYFAVDEVLKKHVNASTLLYNGRFLHERAVLDCVKNNGMEFLIYETLRDRFIVRNHGFHDRIYNQKEMINFWEQSKEIDKFEIGSRYFAELRGKKNIFNNDEHIPNHFLNKPFIVFFTNSDDEAVGFWESWNTPMLDQISMIQHMQTLINKKSDVNFIVKIHPNLVNKPFHVQKRWEKLRSNNNTFVIKPNQKISTYELITKAKAVFSFGSTASLEAAFCKIPSFVLADCWFDQIGAVTKIENINEIEVILKNLDFSKINLENSQRAAAIRGYWLERAGNGFSNSKLREIGWGAWEADSIFNSNLIRPTIFTMSSKVINRTKRFLRGLSKS